MNRMTNLRVLDRSQDFTRFNRCCGAQRCAHVAVVLLELAFDLPLDVATVPVGDPFPFDQQISQRPIQPHGPAGTDVGELRLVDQVILKRDHGKQQIPIDIYL